MPYGLYIHPFHTFTVCRKQEGMRSKGEKDVRKFHARVRASLSFSRRR